MFLTFYKNKTPMRNLPHECQRQSASGDGRNLYAILGVSDSAIPDGITVTHSRGFSPHSTAGLTRPDRIPYVIMLLF